MELLVRVIDKGPNVDTTKAGDVISICDDDWPWSDEELNNPYWMIISSDIMQTLADSLLATPRPTTAEPVPKRSYMIDLTQLDFSGLDFPVDGQRRASITPPRSLQNPNPQPIMTIPIDPDDLTSAAKLKDN